VDVARAESRSVVAAVEAPIDFPPIKQAVVPGDKVVLALAAGVPQGADVVAAIVPAIVEGGVAWEDITVLHTQGDVDAGLVDPRSGLPAELQQSVQLLTHNPGEQTQLAYLAADDQGEPIYMNRRMCEADFFIPIGCLQPSEAVNQNGGKEIWNETIYPTFGDQKTIDRLAPTGVAQSKGQLARRAKQIDEVAWQLGVQVTAQVAPAGEDRALEVFIGAPASVFREGRELCRQAWLRVVPRRAKLVIIGISGGAAQQTWENVGRALETALNVVAEGGAIVICTELREPLGPALRQLAGAADTDAAQQRLRKMHSSDAALARLLATELERASVYLLSQLDEDTVTPLGIAHVGDPADVARLASRAESCVLLGDGQYVVASVEARD
jgi:nickel-dependent lactate racemase